MRCGRGRRAGTCLEQAAHMRRRAGPSVQVAKAQRVEAVHHLIVAAEPDSRIQQQPLQPAGPELTAHLRAAG